MADDPTAKTQAPSGLGKPAKGGTLSKGKSAAGAATGGGARPAEARTQGMYSIDAAGRKTFRRNASVLAQWRDSHWRSAVVLDCSKLLVMEGLGLAARGGRRGGVGRGDGARNVVVVVVRSFAQRR